MLITVVFLGIVAIVAALALIALAICAFDGSGRDAHERGQRLSHANRRS